MNANLGPPERGASGAPLDGPQATLEYSPGLLAGIGRATIAGDDHSSRGGAETGGVLFGARSGGRVHLAAWRPIACEHAFGRLFVLSDRDRAAFGQLLREADKDPALKGLQPVGAFISHSHGELAVTAEDRMFFDELFPQSWQVLLIVRHFRAGNTRARFFVRAVNGRLAPAANLEEFTIYAARPNGAPPVLNATAKYAAEYDASASATAPVVAGQASAPRLAPHTSEAAEANNAAAAVPTGDIPRFLLNQKPTRKSRWGYWFSGVVAIAALAVAGIFIKQQYFSPPPPPIPYAFALRLREAPNSQIYIDWDRTAPIIQSARRAVLEITDGDKPQTINVAAPELRGGTFTYRRQSGDVKVRLRIDVDGRPPVEEFARFLGSPGDNSAAAGSGAASTSTAQPPATSRTRTGRRWRGRRRRPSPEEDQ